MRRNRRYDVLIGVAVLCVLWSFTMPTLSDAREELQKLPHPSWFAHRAYAPVWVETYSQAVDRATAEKKPLLIVWSMEDCPHCVKLEAEFRREQLQWLDKGYVLCKLRREKFPTLAKEMRVAGYPTMIRAIITQGGTGVRESGRQAGWMPAEQVDRWLKTFAGKK